MTFFLSQVLSRSTQFILSALWRQYFKRHTEKYIIYLLALLLIVTAYLFCPSASATTIILIRTENDIVAGADSRNRDENDKIRPELQCKIRQVGDLLFASSGFVEDKVTGFSVNKVVAEAAQKGGSINEIAARIDIAIVQPLKDALLHVKKAHPDCYEKRIRGKGTFTLCLFRIEKGVPVVYCKQFGEPDMVSNTIAVIKIVRCPGENCHEKQKPFFLGRTEAIMEFMQRYPPPWGIDLVEMVRFMITIEIIAVPNEVGQPIDLVRYDKTGIHWIQRKQECHDNEK